MSVGESRPVNISNAQVAEINHWMEQQGISSEVSVERIDTSAGKGAHFAKQNSTGDINNFDFFVLTETGKAADVAPKSWTVRVVDECKVDKASREGMGDGAIRIASGIPGIGEFVEATKAWAELQDTNPSPEFFKHLGLCATKSLLLLGYIADGGVSLLATRLAFTGAEALIGSKKMLDSHIMKTFPVALVADYKK